MIKAVVFDLDDTLYPEYEYVLSGFQCVITKINKDFGKEIRLGEIVELYDGSRNNVFNRLLDKNDVAYDKAYVADLIAVYKRHSPKIAFYDGAIDAFNFCKSEGIKLGIITDGTPIQQNNKIKALNLKNWVDEYIVTDEIAGTESRKPNKISFETMANKLDVEASQMIYIGDNPRKDFAISETLPVKTIRLLNEDTLYYKEDYLNDILPTYVVNSFDEIIRIIKHERSI